MLDILIYILALLILLALLWLGFKLAYLIRLQNEMPDVVAQILEEKHRAMLSNLHDGLSRQGDRMADALIDNSERLRGVVSDELKQTRDAMQILRLSQAESLAETREAVLLQLSEMAAALQGKQDMLRSDILSKTLQTLAEQGRADQELIQSTMRIATQQLTSTIENLTKIIDTRLEQISGKVSERLDEGFKKTNETFVSVMERLATIDEAQKKIDGLTTNVVSLQELLGDKRSRGAFGEVQLEALVRNVLPANAYAMQYTFSNGSRVDCAMFLPEPTGTVAVDSKFPLENYHRMFDSGLNDLERKEAQKQFKLDIKKHVDDISKKYIIPNETSDGAVMFIPAEAVFAEIHAYHSDVVDYAMQKRVWIVSPTTMMAVLNTARAVMKDVETRKQVHIIKDSLSKLSKDFHLFDERMLKLATHIRQAHEDAERVQITSQKISKRFAQIEAVELDQPVLTESGAKSLGSDELS
ncbi:DNA recombination protein RmuC [Sulfurirhabdus autotrophica]|uniref:DNA recombination protein RmuC n=1 Tax=Sulfurirhabdus autotrophica TaxID=1706046 RepID=A0A4R3XSZ4_9PROT|nr:DNA recombination protein RmuC [Sulfurirhabdus autotrophica]TCV81103.1 DNA recombination protein RmuC [Sulfurirhabdus autotrophica]